MRHRHRLFGSLVLCAAIVGCDSPSGELEYKDGYVAMEGMKLEPISSDHRGIVFITFDLKNVSAGSTVNNFSYVTVAAGSTSAKFDVEAWTGKGCRSTDEPWDVAPGQAQEMRMRVDLTTDPATLDVACQRTFTDPVGFDAERAQTFAAPRQGSGSDEDLRADWSVALEITMDPNQKARATASARPSS